MNDQSPQKPAPANASPFFPLIEDAWSYSIDAFQRGILFLDAMRQRGEQYEAHIAKLAPHVLKFDCELIADGRTLARPVNYVLVRIAPPHGVEIDERKRPFVVFDPRAGHGPGIGGFKAQSEIGVALKAGHPCYFVGFLPEPMPGQTIGDVADAEAAFLERVIALHPQAEGKPAVIGNCQAGWAVMMVAARRPDLFGPIIVAGSPLSYWAGVRGENPMRYTGGLLGGSWMTALLGDLGNGKFDGAWLVSNFENLNPANTYWTKSYNLYSKIDTEVPRYLEFEQWWSGHVLLGADEIQSIVDELFVGNKLATAEIVSPDGWTIDLRNIRSPIVVFCSKADNITPPPQALDWILDLYRDVDDIRAHVQTIVYAVHESAGHLGIFVSGSVAKKEHDEFASNIDLIDVLPPGLYEAVITPKEVGDVNADLIGGNYLVRFEPRTLDDIRALGCNTDEEDRRFAAAARLSEVNLGLYRTFVQPWVRLFTTEGTADLMRRMHPLRLQYEMFGRGSPLASSIEMIAKRVQDARQPALESNAFWQAQSWVSGWMEHWLNSYRDARDTMLETTFHIMYGAPAIQALAGLPSSEASPRRRPGVDTVYRAFVDRRVEELKRNVGQGGPREAALRAALYIRLPEGTVDERGFGLLERMRKETGAGLALEDFKQIVREQFLTLLLDERKAIAAIPEMLARDSELAPRMVDGLRRLIQAVGVQSEAAKTRLAEIEDLIKQSPANSLGRDGARVAQGQPKSPGGDRPRPRLRKVSGDD